MRERGKVVKILEGNLAEVHFPASPACVKCGICRDVGEQVAIQARNEAGAKLGNTVEVEIPMRDVLWAQILLFVLPVAALMAGYYVGGIPIAFTFLGLSLAGLFAYDRFFRSKKVACRIVRVLQ